MQHDTELTEDIKGETVKWREGDRKIKKNFTMVVVEVCRRQVSRCYQHDVKEYPSHNKVGTELYHIACAAISFCGHNENKIIHTTWELHFIFAHLKLGYGSCQRKCNDIELNKFVN
jgi:hypothetical protein